MQLSNSTLSVFLECMRCFWLDKKKGVARPRGIFSSLPNGIDKLLKEKMDGMRGTLPEILSVPQTEGFVLFDDAALLKKYRHWKSSPLKYTDPQGNTLVGALDDILYNPATGLYAPHDWKTKGSEPDQAYCEQYYQKQIDLYAFLGKCGGLDMADFGTLTYFWPIESERALIKFQTKTFVLEAVPQRAKATFEMAIKCLNSEIMPPAGDDCEYCKYVGSVHNEMPIGAAV